MVEIVFLTGLGYHYRGSKEALRQDLIQYARHFSHASAERIGLLFQGVEKVLPSLVLFLEAHPSDVCGPVKVLSRTAARHLEILGKAVPFEPYSYLPDRQDYALTSVTPQAREAIRAVLQQTEYAGGNRIPGD